VTVKVEVKEGGRLRLLAAGCSCNMPGYAQMLCAAIFKVLTVLEITDVEAGAAVGPWWSVDMQEGVGDTKAGPVMPPMVHGAASVGGVMVQPVSRSDSARGLAPSDGDMGGEQGSTDHSGEVLALYNGGRGLPIGAAHGVIEGQAVENDMTLLKNIMREGREVRAAWLCVR
jgi:hypothetical protein